MVYLDLQEQSWLQTQDSPGAHNPAFLSPGVEQWCVWQPAMRPAGAPWDNLYVYQTSQDPGVQITLDMAVTFRMPQDLLSCEAWEFEFDKILNNQRYDGGWQARFDDGHWWMFDVLHEQWVRSAVAIQPGDFIAGKPTRIVAQYAIIGGTTKFISLTVNGKFNVVGASMASQPKTAVNHMNWAWQLDSRGHGAPINVALESYQVFTQ